MQGIQFGYDPEKIIIHDLNLHARPGSLVAIVGPTGAGKTTIINLLMRFYDPQKGHILMEGRDSMDITRRSLRAAYTMVLQDTWLFYGTIYDNIAFSRPGATRERSSPRPRQPRSTTSSWACRTATTPSSATTD